MENTKIILFTIFLILTSNAAIFYFFIFFVIEQPIPAEKYIGRQTFYAILDENHNNDQGEHKCI